MAQHSQTATYADFVDLLTADPGTVFPSHKLTPERKSKHRQYEVVTHYDEYDRTTRVFIWGVGRSYDRLIKMKRHSWWGKSPRLKVIEAQEALRLKADELRRRDYEARHEYELTIRS